MHLPAGRSVQVIEKSHDLTDLPMSNHTRRQGASFSWRRSFVADERMTAICGGRCADFSDLLVAPRCL